MNDNSDDLKTNPTAEQMAEEFSFLVVGEIERLEHFREAIKQAFLAGYEAAISVMEV